MIIVLWVAIFYSSVLLSRVWGNVGLVMLVPVLQSECCASPMAAQAGTSLRWAIVWDKNNRGAYRGMGWLLGLRGDVEEAGQAWRTAGLTAQEMIQAGEAARKASLFELAQEWYNRAVWVEPENGDPWYYLGISYEESDEWDSALNAYQTALKVGTFDNVSRSSVYYRMALIFQWHSTPPVSEKALRALDDAIRTADFQDTWEAADAHYRRGAILRWQGAAPEDYVVEFERAIATDFSHQMAHVLLGTTYYAMFGEVEIAEKEITMALEVDPQNKWAYLHLGNIYHDSGMCEAARIAYRKALEIDPTFNLARVSLEKVCEHK